MHMAQDILTTEETNIWRLRQYLKMDRITEQMSQLAAA